MCLCGLGMLIAEVALICFNEKRAEEHRYTSRCKTCKICILTSANLSYSYIFLQQCGISKAKKSLTEKQ